MKGRALPHVLLALRPHHPAGITAVDETISRVSSETCRKGKLTPAGLDPLVPIQSRVTTRHRSRRACKWLGLCAIGFLASIELASIWFIAGVWITPRFGLGLGRGALILFGSGTDQRLPDLTVGHAARSEDFCWWLEQSGIYGVGWTLVPLWLVIAMLVPPTVWLWYRDHQRSRPGCCEACGYDRQGLLSNAPCPECGVTPDQTDMDRRSSPT